jgi:2-methylcitrate dehydratase PrpD
VQGNIGVSEKLTQFVFAAGDLPAKVRRECVRALVNAVGCSVGGSQHDLVARATSAMAEFFGKPTTSLLGRGAKTDMLNAALLNGLAGAAYSFDDTYSDALLHPVGPVAMTLLALAERSPVAGGDFLTALALGVETSCRLIKMLITPPAQHNVAWSATGIASGAGVAMAAGKLLGLDRLQLESALGIAISEAGCTRVTHGAMSASLPFGHSAHIGLRAALLAQQGFTSSPGCIENRFGYASVYARNANPDVLVEGLGEEWELLSNTYKPFPSGVVIHPPLDGMLQLKTETGFAAEAVERIVLRVVPAAVTLCSRPHPKDEVAAKLSIEHWIAAAALTGHARIAEGAMHVVNNPEAIRLRDCIEFQPDAALASDAAEVCVILKDGRRLTRMVEHCISSIERPMTDPQLDEKFLGQAEFAIGADRSRQVLDLCWRAESLADVGEIARAAC